MTTEEPKIVEVPDNDESESDDDMPELEAAAPAGEAEVPGEAGASADVNRSRSENKARKALQKLGLKPVSGVQRVTLKKSPNILFTIANPDVYKSKTGDAYVVFGDYKIDDMNAQAHAQAQYAQAQQLNKAQAEAAVADDDDIPELEEASDAAVDETGLDAKEIEMVMAQASVSRAKAVKALRENDNDVVNAIMALTT